VAWNDGLVGPTLDIAASNDRRLRVLAGPGTGKTFAIKRYVMRLLEERHVDPRRILVVTFTRTAAHDLRNELQALNIPGCERINASTLHSFCFRLLTQENVLNALDRTPRPLVTVTKRRIRGCEYTPLLADLGTTDEFGDKRRRNRRIAEYEAAYAQRQEDEVFAARDQVAARFEAALLDWLRFHEAILIGELIPLAYSFLARNPQASERSRYSYVIVDEYQDLNRAEQSIIDVVSERATLAIVGDADQSIYRFKYANPEGIQDFSERHRDTADRTLRECRRCGEQIVTLANNVIRGNHLEEAFVPMTTLADNPPGEVHVVQWTNLSQEVNGIAAYVNHLIGNRQYLPDDIMVLCQRRRIAYVIRDAMRQLGIPAHSLYHDEVLEDPQAQEAFALLTLLCRTEERVALRFWLGYNVQDQRRNQYQRLRIHCEATGEAPFEAMSRMASGELDARGYAQILARFRLLQQRLHELANLNGRLLIDAVFPLDQAWAEPLHEVLSGADIQDDAPRDSLLALVRDYVAMPEIPSEGNFVRIMSLHASKGLTSRVTIVASTVEGIIPNIDPDLTIAEQQEVEREQRRLFYVAVTRPREILLISSPARINAPMAPLIGLGNQARLMVASRFLNEIGHIYPSRRGDQWMENGFR